MDKEKLLQELALKISSGEITREEVVHHFTDLQSHSDGGETEFKKDIKHLAVTKILYIFGTSVIVLGILTFVAAIWDVLGSTTRIVLTLGLGITFALSGSILLKKKPGESIGGLFHVIGGVLIPGGVLVMLSELNWDIISKWPSVIAFGSLFVFYMLLNLVHKNVSLTFFTIVNGTIFINQFVGATISGLTYEASHTVSKYVQMVIGANYLLLAHVFREGWNKKLVSPLQFFGTTWFFMSAFLMVFDSIIWQILFLLFVIGGFALSIYMKSRTILGISTLFLIVHFSYITGKYFAGSLGWPLSLILIGFALIGLGYMSIQINKKYLTK
jgi:hypothetical protein